MKLMNLSKLIQAWEISNTTCSFEKPASDRDLLQAEESLGIRLPPTLRSLYQYSDGMYLLDGNLSIYPVLGSGDNLGLTNASSKLREWGWPIPDEVLVFGNNGSDELFGIWYPDTGSQIFRCPVLEIAEIFDGPNMAVLATDLMPFLFGWSLYYLRILEADRITLDVLEIPDSMRFSADDLDEMHFIEFRRWADPTLPDPAPDAYTGGYDAEGLRKLFAMYSG
jgi:hypothetical protein